MRGVAPCEEHDYEQKALTMALAILVERINRLPEEDREELWGLMKELPTAGKGEERNSIVTAMREILDQAPVRVNRMSQGEEEPSDRLKGWIAYVSERIKFFRLAAHLTQAELAEKAGLPQSHISRLESGKHSPSRATLEKIAGALGRPLKDFDPSDCLYRCSAQVVL
jgi:DNA-binding XRE family transcriptional regulator